MTGGSEFDTERTTWLTGTEDIHGNVLWRFSNGEFWDPYGPRLVIQFINYGRTVKERYFKKHWEGIITREQIKFIFKSGDRWYVNILELKKEFEQIHIPEWIDIDFVITEEDNSIEKRRIFDREEEHNKWSLEVTKDEVRMSRQQKIFLSHKSADKPLVEKYYNLLKLIGFDVWLDKHDMQAGANLNRAIMQGIKDSKAVVFFVTPNYIDDKYLSNEIDHAMEEKIERGDDFTIITLLFSDSTGNIAEVPQLLRKYVYKEVSSELEGLEFILKALPVKISAEFK